MHFCNRPCPRLLRVGLEIVTEVPDNAVLVAHPLLTDGLTRIRDRNTATAEFRRHSERVSRIVVLEATRDLGLTPAAIDTPVGPTTGAHVSTRVVFLPILRAGLAMLGACQDMVPSASVGFIGLERDETTAQAREYYRKIPIDLGQARVIVLDPMLATGGSLDQTLAAARDAGAASIIVACIVAAPEGLARLATAHPDVRVCTAAIDERLNERKYIVPGLGDFGDRYYGT